MWTHARTCNTSFQTKKGTPIKNVPKPSLGKVEWTIAIIC